MVRHPKLPAIHAVVDATDRTLLDLIRVADAGRASRSLNSSILMT
jgi:hypothetical protein